MSDTPGLRGDDAAWGFGLRFPNSSGLRGRLAYKEVQNNFNPAMGYVSRRDVRDVTADLGYTQFLNSALWQSAFGGVDVQRIERIGRDGLGGGVQSEAVKFRLLELETTTRDRISLSATRNRENVRNAFTLFRTPARSVGVSPGDYRFNEYGLDVSSGGQRNLSMGANLALGDFYDGRRRNAGANVRWNRAPWLVTRASFDWNRIHLDQGDFTTRLTSLTTEVAFSSTLFWISLVQYDNVSEEIGINTRLHWIPRAGQEGFIVLNHNLQDWERTGTFQSERSDLSLKFRYTIRF